MQTLNWARLYWKEAGAPVAVSHSRSQGRRLDSQAIGRRVVGLGCEYAGPLCATSIGMLLEVIGIGRTTILVGSVTHICLALAMLSSSL